MDPNDELYHYGVKGMKWGIRRTPEQLGHVTKKARNTAASVSKAVGSAAKKAGSAVAKAASESKQRREAKKKHAEEVKRTQRNSKKKISELTNDELRERIQRMELEQRYRQLTPQQKSKGQAFLSTVGNQVIKPAATNAARQYLEKQLKNALGLNDSGNNDPLKKLREEADRATLQNRKEAAEEQIRNRASRAAQAAAEASSSSNSSGNSSNASSNNSSRSSRSNSYDDDVIEVTNFTVGDASPTVTYAGRVYTQNILGGKSIAGLLPPGDERNR